ncbi:MAG: choice-of-anchor D domain-containing protein [Deltaproteobacteria bacterium]|nr:choice-of-anchor D domain-containing protein [Deltaproteobacteria bacterium]
MDEKRFPTLWPLGLALLLAAAACDSERVRVTRPDLSVLVPGPGGTPTACEDTSCALDYGLVYLGNTDTQTVVVRNFGDGELSLQEVLIQSDLNPAPFSLPGFEMENIPPGQSLPVSVMYAPQEEGEHSGVLRIKTDDPDHPLVEVSLSGRSEIVPAPQLQVCVRVDPTDPDNDEMQCGPPSEVDFGPVALVPLGEPVSTPIVLRNLGKETLVVRNIRKTSGTSTEFYIEPDDYTAQIPAIENDGEVIHEDEFLLWYSPSDGGQDEGFLEIESNDPDNRSMQVTVRGQGIAPRVCADPLKLEFGSVAIGHPKKLSFNVTNCGLLTLTVGTIRFGENSSEAFSFSALPMTPFDLEPGEGVDIEVVFNPIEEGDAGGRIYLQTNDPAAETGYILLRGEGSDDPICDIEFSPIRLNFGFVDVGASTTRSTSLRNTGTANCDVTSIGELSGAGAGAFTLAQAPIIPFTLGPGEAQTLTFRYQPADAGPHRATVDIESNDFEEAVTTLELYGNDPDVPECNARVVPQVLAFGTVAMWRTAIMEVKVINEGAEACILHGLDFSPGTDQAFTLAEAPSLPARVPAHDEATVLVGFTPIQRRSHAGQLTVVTDDPDTPIAVVDLAGNGEELNLMVIPNSLDFGLVTVGCASPQTTITVYNIGNSSVEIQDIFLDALRTDPEFSMIGLDHHGSSSLPFTLSSADSFTIQLRYVPEKIAPPPNSGVLVIQSTAAIDTVLEVPMVGEGTDQTSQTDVFNQLDEPKVDVLWVIDNSGSMIPQQQALAANFSTFINWAITLDTDFHIGVVSTEINEPETPADFFNIYPGILVNYPGFPRVLDNNTPNLAQAFAKNINVGTCCSDEQESGLHAAMMTLSEPLISSPAANGGFMREDAKLVIIMVSDEVDQSPATVDFYVDFYKSIKGYRNDQLMDVSCITGDVPGGCSAGGIYAEAAPRYKFVQEATGGIFRSHCSTNWGSTLSDLGLDAFAARTQFPLTRPAQPDTIVVMIDEGDGFVVVPFDEDESGDGWTYDEETNSIVFGDEVVPGRGATIEASYETICL